MDQYKAKLNNEVKHFKAAIKETKFKGVDKKKVVFELLANGVAGIIALLSSWLLGQVLVVKSVKNLWGLTAKKDSYMVSKSTFEWLNWVIIFIVGLLVFTFVEQVMECYLEEREKAKRG